MALLALAGLLTLNLHLKRDLLYPPTLFCLSWLAGLVILVTSTDYFPLRPGTLLLFVSGAAAFSIGGFFSWGYRLRQGRTVQIENRPRVRVILDVLLLVLAVLLPIFWTTSDLQEARMLAVETNSSGGGIFGNLVVLSFFVAIACSIEYDGTALRRWRLYFAAALTIGYTFATGNKGAVRLLFTLFFITALRTKFSAWQMMKITLAGLVVFVAGLALINFGYMDFDFSMDSLSFLSRAVLNYAVSSFVGFDYMDSSVPAHHTILRFFIETANSLGWQINILPIHAPFTAISADENTNTYTIYYSYVKDLGNVGAVAMLAFMGFITTMVYRLARRGPIALAMYGIWAMAIVFSITAEFFWLNLNFTLKMIGFMVLLYHVLPKLRAGVKTLTRSAPLT